jgi:RNA polymerase sigma-32 factor
MFSLSNATFNLKDIKRLSFEEEQRLAIDYFEHNNIESAHLLTISHLPLVVSIAWRYSHFFRVSVEDLIQEGFIGLMKAVKTYNPYMGARLASFAFKAIRREMKVFIMQTWSLVKIGTTTEERNTFFKALEVSKEEKIEGEKQIKALALRVKQRDYSLFSPLNENTSDTFIDFIKDAKEDSEELYLKQDLKKFIKESLNLLTANEKMVIEKRYLEGNKNSLQLIANSMGISKQRANQIEKHALCKIKKFLIEKGY